jgi:hypothetical protein
MLQFTVNCIESVLVFSFVILGTAFSLDLILGGMAEALRQSQT